MRKYQRLRIAGGTYFFTVVTYQRQPLFADKAAVEIFHQEHDRVRLVHPFEIVAFVVLPDHIHTIWSLPDGDADYSTRWMLVKSGFSRRFAAMHPRKSPADASRERRREQTIWQRRFWEHSIRDAADLDAHLDYIHYNPVHHGLTTAPAAWPHSTFNKFVQCGRYEEWWGADAMPPMPTWVNREQFS